MAAIYYAIIPVVAAVAGAAIAIFRPPGKILTSAIQHFAAGVVFAAAAAEILPDVLHQDSPVATLLGGFIGVAIMLMLRRLEGVAGGQVGFLAAVGFDVFIDGLVLGIGFAAGASAGVLLTVALTLEILFLGLTTATALARALSSRALAVVSTGALMLMLPLGSLLAIPVGSFPAPVQTGIFAFGLIALLYLVTEELLVEAHEILDRPWVTAMFFVGFLLLLLLEEAIG